MTNDELLALVEREEAACIVHFTSLLSEQRRKAMQYYYGQPYGDEVEGKSQVVTTEVKDAVEGVLPALMSIFTSSDEIVRFDPQGPEDEEAAQQQTDYANYVFSRMNNGFLALYCLIKDALLLKNGYVKVYWEDYEDVTQESYEGLNDLDLATLQQDDELELVEIESYPDPSQPQIPPEIAAQMAQMGQQLPQMMLHNAKFRRTRKQGRICIDPLPPEEVLISREAPNDITKARFVEHRTLRSLSEIREMGYEVEDGIADYAPNADFNLERVQRLSFDDAMAYRLDETSPDPSMRRVWLCEAYVHTDFDDDGIAELRKITKVGRKILDNVEFDSLPIIGGPAILMPHKHYGLSFFDLVGDLQRIKSVVLRNLLDNAYVANNGRMEVLDGMVNMTDLLTARPNGVIRVKAINSVRRIENPLLGAPFYQLMDYLDRIKQNRIGATDFPNAVEPDAINAKAAFVDHFKTAALERITLMARVLAEGPIKQIFWKIIELTAKHQDKARMVKLRGKWVQIDPREWKNRLNMSVTVGLGTGNQQTTLNGAMGIMNIQAGMLQAGLGGRTVNEVNIYRAANAYAKAVFPKEHDSFFTNPATLPPPQQQPNPDMIELQLKAHKMELQDQQKKEKMAFDAQMDARDKAFQAEVTKFEALVSALEQQRQLAVDQRIKGVEIDMEARHRLVDMLESVKSDHAKQAHDERMVAMQGMIDSLMEQQRHNNEMLAKTREAMLAPKKIVRDEKGRAQRVEVDAGQA